MYTKKETIFVRRRPNTSLFGANSNLIEKNFSITASSKNKGILRGLTSEEEKKYLPQIIGISANHNEWEKSTIEYWANISVPVPDGEGLKLDISMEYNSEEEAKRDTKKISGRPLNLTDYIVWRYCLVYSRVANKFEDVEASPRIKFYLYSEEQERINKNLKTETKLEATRKMLEILNDKKKIKAVLTVIASKPLAKVKVAYNTPEDDYNSVLDTIVTEMPEEFLDIVKDESIIVKAFIEDCIINGFLKRISNTTSIMDVDDNIVIGKDIDEAVGYLTSPIGATLKTKLKAKLSNS